MQWIANKLDLSVQIIDIKAQKIDGSTLKMFERVRPVFYSKIILEKFDSLIKQFFLTNISINIIFEITFFYFFGYKCLIYWEKAHLEKLYNC